MFGLGGGGELLGVLMFIFVIIAVVAAILMPFWVYRIRCECIAANETLRQILETTGDYW